MNTVSLTVDIPPNEWLSANGRYQHWTRSRKVKALRRRAHMLARSKGLPKQKGLVRITAHIHGRTNRWSDPNNAADTTKPLIDGLRDAGVLADDNYAHVLGPDHRRGDPLPDLNKGWHRIVLTIEPVHTREV